MRNPPEGMVGPVPLVLANMRKRSINMTFATLHQLERASLMRHPQGGAGAQGKIGPRLNGRRIFRSNTSTCGLSDILGERLVRRSHANLQLRLGPSDY